MDNNYKILGSITVLQLNTLHNGIIETLIDTEDLLKVMKLEGSWYLLWKSNNIKRSYAGNYSGILNGKKCRTRLHRYIMDAPKNLQVDHINGNPLDNRKCNLRLVTNKENQQNRRTQHNNTSGIAGLNWNRSLQRWVFRMSVNGKRKSIYFKDYESAKLAVHQIRNPSS